MSFQAGETVAGYRIIGQMGAGGMATVYKAWHERLDRTVAIKLLRQSFARDAGFIERFQREARIIARLDHPHIVPIYDYAERDGTPFFVMKFIEGGTLKRRLIKRGLTRDETLRMMTQLASALDYAHESGVLHRDIKPSNILIDERDQACLSDFGLARIAQVGDSTISHDMMLGTPQYISPEQALGLRDLTAATDVYSFGIVLYELLLGAPPFHGETPYAIVHEQISSPPVPPSQLDPDLGAAVDAALLRALAKAPDERYQSAEALMADLRRALSDSAPDLTARAPLDRPRQLARDDFADEARQLRDLAVGMRTKIQENKAKRKRADESPEKRIRQRVRKKFRARRGLIAHSLVYFAVFFLTALGMILAGDAATRIVLEMMPPAQIWGVFLALHFVRYTFRHGLGAAAREAEIRREMALDDGADETEIRARTEKKFRSRRALALHAAVLSILGLPILLFDLFGPSRADQIMFVLVWALLLGWQSLRYYYRHGGGAARQEAEIEGEVTRQLRLAEMREEGRRQRLHDPGDERLTGGRELRLGADGELSDSFVAETMDERRRGSGAN